MNQQEKGKVMVIGHRNPDTDSICSAIAYANLKNKTSDGTVYEACRAGEPNQETAYVLKRFRMKAPRRCLDVSPQVQDIDIRQVEGVDGQTTMRHAWETMRDAHASTLPITTQDGHLEGLITLTDVAMANMDVDGAGVLAAAHASLDQVCRTLNGTLITGDPNDRFEKGKIVIGAASPDAMEGMVQPGDVVILANRYETQLCAIELEASCIVVCIGSAVSRTIVKLAADRGCAIISTPYDTYEAARLINQSVPICHYMIKDDLMTFDLNTSVEEARTAMGKVRHQYFPVLDKKGRYQGMISRRNLLNLKRKQLILVDHNERTQAVEGFEQADILEIIDHHRLGNLETNSPLYFRNQPVGCTATIIYQMYGEQGVEITPEIAGILCSAILSDTLMFRSPTCTPLDEALAKRLAKIAGVDIDEFASEMFEAGEKLDGKTAEEVFLQDFKVFMCGDIRFGVAQGSYMTRKNLLAAEALLQPYLEEARNKQNVEDIYMLLTDVPKEESVVISDGRYASEVLSDGFETQPAEDGSFTLPGVVSRKKQFIPALMTAYQEL